MFVKKEIILVAVILTGLVLLVFGYGFWHLKTHGSAYITIGLKNSDNNQSDHLSNAVVMFLDSNGNVLAKGVSEENFDFVNLIHPKVGNCREIEKQAPFSKEARKKWNKCFHEHSIWIPSWIRKVHTVQVKHPVFSTITLPISIQEEESDWLYWWAPHPHIGGKPYSRFRAEILISKKDISTKAYNH